MARDLSGWYAHFWRLVPVLAALLALGCAGRESGRPLLTVKMPLHLEDHLDAANIEVTEAPAQRLEPMEWRFDRPQPGWRPVVPLSPDRGPVLMTRAGDALRVNLTEANVFTLLNGRRSLQGGIYVELPEWHREDWAYVAVEARATGGVHSLTLMFNLHDELGDRPRWGVSKEFQVEGEYARVIGDGKVHSYLLRADWPGATEGRQADGPWRHLGLHFGASIPSEPGESEPPSIEILSVRVVPKGADYSASPVGVRTEVRGQAYRRTLYAHTPARLGYRVRVPVGGRLDVGLGVLRGDVAMRFRIGVTSERSGSHTFFDEGYSDTEWWAQRSVDLSRFAGEVVTLALEAESKVDGAVALWAAPTLSGAVHPEKPNVIFYIIDGAAADAMSVYGYSRSTTPNLERIACEGAVFESAYSNSSWTKTSTPSFMTSLQHSVLGGYREENDPLPDQAVTMAQHLHGAGYQTAVFATNPYAGIMSSLDRGVDVLREAGIDPNSASSRVLHEDFFRWRAAYPATPYWVHFQTTDVHWPRVPQPPMAGIFIDSERRARYDEWERRVGIHPGAWQGGLVEQRLREMGVDRQAFFSGVRDLYDETMAHQDYQLGLLVERLKASGEWENTLLIVAADHGAVEPALTAFDPETEPHGASRVHWVYRVPMIFVWPNRIAPGQRLTDTVSMIDMLPTILDLVNLPRPEVYQGQSLAPLLLGHEGREPQPTILDEFYVSDPETGEMSGDLAMIDGRWLAWMAISPTPADPPPEDPPPRLMLYDMWTPYGGSIHEEHPDLVARYTGLLEEVWQSHQELGARFTRSGGALLTQEQLRTLKALGYIQ